MWIKIIILKVVGISKTWFYRPFYCPHWSSNLRVLWKRQLDTRSIHRFIESIWYRRSFNIVKKTKNIRCQYHESCLVCQLLNGRKQYIKITESADTVKKNIKCEVLQGWILGPLLFLLHVKDLPNSISNVQMSNNVCRRYYFFCEHSNINTLFKTVNDKLIKVTICSQQTNCH